jgi:hypothetical protein
MDPCHATNATTAANTPISAKRSVLDTQKTPGGQRFVIGIPFYLKGMANGGAPPAGELQRTFSLKVPFRDFRKFTSQKFFGRQEFPKRELQIFRPKVRCCRRAANAAPFHNPTPFRFLRLI